MKQCFHEFKNLIPEEQTHIEDDLIVSASPCMDLAS
jgi:hypothetical protein